MLRKVVTINVILGFAGLDISPTEGSRWKRIIVANDLCNLPPYSPSAFSAIYESTEKTLRRANIDQNNLDQLYQMVTDRLDWWKSKPREQSPITDSVVPAMILLKLSRELGNRDCLDYCTFILAHNNCDAARFLSACRPSMRRSSLISTMIDNQVLPMIERCQGSLVNKTILLNATTMGADLHMYVSLITETLTIFKPTDDLKTIQEAMLKSRKPIHDTRSFVRPHRIGFCKKIFDVMQQIEALKGQDELSKAFEARSLSRKEARTHFNRLIRKPCKHYIERLYKAMDASMFYGRIIELDRSRFALEDIGDDRMIQFYELMRRYDTCVFLEDYDFSANWPRMRTEIGLTA